MHLPQATRPPEQLRGPPRRDAHDDASCEPSATDRRELGPTHERHDDDRDEQHADTHQAVAEDRGALDDVTRVGGRRGRLDGRLHDRLLNDGRLDLGGRGRLAGRRRGSTVATTVTRVGARDGDVVGVADRAVRDEHPEHVGTARRPRERTRLSQRATLGERELLRDVLRPVADDHGLRERDVLRAQVDDVVDTRTVRRRRERGADRRADDRRGRVAGPVEGELVDEQGLGRGVEPVRDGERRRERVDGNGDRARERRDDADGVVLDVQAGTVDAEAALHLRVDAHGGDRNGEGGDVVGTGARVADLADGRPGIGRRGTGRGSGHDDGQGHGGSSRQGRHEAVALAHVVSKW